MAPDRLGVIDDSRIEQRGEAIASVRTNFQLIKQFTQIRLIVITRALIDWGMRTPVLAGNWKMYKTAAETCCFF